MNWCSKRLVEFRRVLGEASLGTGHGIGRRLLSLIIVIVPCSACFTVGEHDCAPVPLAEDLSWVREGRTQRSDLVTRLGPPSWSFEGGRIQTWALGSDRTSQPAPPGSAPKFAPAYSLVVVFGSDERVARASLVKL